MQSIHRPAARFLESDILRRSYLPLFVAPHAPNARISAAYLRIKDRQQSPVSPFRVRTGNIIKELRAFGKSFIKIFLCFFTELFRAG
jgi:hypothetical protein